MSETPVKKISFCTTCMGRLHHLQQTLPENLRVVQEEAQRLGVEVEFVLLNYGSKDGMEEWVKESYTAEIESGLIRYASYPEAEHFNMGHAKNMAHRVATGDVLVNLDADNFVAEGYTTRIFNLFSQDKNIIAMKKKNTLENSRDTEGRIAVSSDTFYRVGGYNEAGGWGAEDKWFIQKACNVWVTPRIKTVRLTSAEIGNSVEHSDQERIVNLEDDAAKKSAKRLARIQGVLSSVESAGIAAENMLSRKLRPLLLPIENLFSFGAGDVYINFSDTPDAEMQKPVPDRSHELWKALPEGALKALMNKLTKHAELEQVPER